MDNSLLDQVIDEEMRSARGTGVLQLSGDRPEGIADDSHSRNDEVILGIAKMVKARLVRMRHLKEKEEREKEDARIAELRLEDAERREGEAEMEVRETEVRIEEKELNLREYRLAMNEKKEAIVRMREALLNAEDEYVRQESVLNSRTDSLERSKEKLGKARRRVVWKREQRKKAAKEVDEHPHSLRMRYSRGCGICLAANPRRRAVMVACGHFTCVLCAEQMSDGTGTQFPCPFCRKLTTYVKTFEDMETPEESQQLNDTRKRRNNENEQAKLTKRRYQHIF